MTCNEAGEYVSALYDGETVPRTAAEHLGSCARCGARLKSYVEIGVALRRIASLDIPDEARPPVWDKPRWSVTGWWGKGWQMMRVPRFAFALLLVGLVVLGSRLAVVEVRAHSDGTVLLLKVTPEGGQPMTCALSAVDKRQASCASVGGLKGGVLSYRIKLLGTEGGRAQLGVQSQLGPAVSGTYLPSALDVLPETRYTFEPGQTLQMAVAAMGPLSVTGEWTDHMPVFGFENKNLDPGPRELRVSSPLLLRNGKVVGDLEGGIAVTDKVEQGVFLYMPGEGRFQFSLAPVAGAVAGRVKLNRLSFESGGAVYSVVTGTPIARADTVWVLRDPGYKPDAGIHGAFIGADAVTPPATTETVKP